MSGKSYFSCFVSSAFTAAFALEPPFLQQDFFAEEQGFPPLADAVDDPLLQQAFFFFVHFFALVQFFLQFSSHL
jgi:hypothetical protein